MTQTPSQQTIPGYEILEKLGQGGMGAVYKARQSSMDRIVALKILPKRLARQKEFKERFFREARAAGKLSHGNIVSAIDAQEANGFCYIAMEFVEGETVANRLETTGGFSEDEALSIVEQITNGLAHAWKAGIIHRDVKPENFLYTKDHTAKLCDLGIAKAPSDGKHTTREGGGAIGTPLYISPEQAEGHSHIDFRADIYSLGVSLYHMLAGEPPFDGPTGATIMLKHITEAAPPLQNYVPGIRKNTVRLVMRMMAKKPEDRYASADALLEDIRRAREGAPVQAPPPQKRKRPSTRKSKRTTRAITRRIKSVQRQQKSGSSATLIIISLVVIGLLIGLIVMIKP